MVGKGTALVAGGTGFIGRNVTERLLRDGYKVRATYHTRSPSLNHAKLEWMKADLTRREDCERVANGVDYVFMCAAETSGAAVMTATPLAHVTPNVLMNTLLMEAAHRAGVKKYLFISSSAAYPPTGERPTSEEEMFNGDPEDVYYAVGWMKRYSEILCKVYAQKIKNGMPTVVVRPSNVYGPHDKFDFERSHMFAALLRRVVERQSPMVIWGTGSDVRDLIYVDDFVDGLMLAFEAVKDYLVVNIAAGETWSVKEVLDTMLKTDGFDGAVVNYDASKPQTTKMRKVDISKARSMLGFKAKVSLAEGIRRTAAWYRKNPAQGLGAH